MDIRYTEPHVGDLWAIGADTIEVLDLRQQGGGPFGVVITVVYWRYKGQNSVWTDHAPAFSKRLENLNAKPRKVMR